MPAALPIPPGLSNAAWQKAKGNIAKLAGKTGVGEALKAFHAGYAQIDFTLFDAKMACPGAKLVSVVDAKKKDAIAHHKDKVEAARKLLIKVRDTAKDTAAKFKKNKLIPNSATKAAEAIEDAADKFYIVMKNNSVYFTSVWDSYDELVTELNKRAEEGRRAIKGYIVSIKSDGAKVNQTPTPDQYIGEAKTGFHQGIRGLNAALATQTDPGLKGFHAKWKPFSQDAYKPKTTDDATVVKEKVKKVLETLKELEQLVG